MLQNYFFCHDIEGSITQFVPRKPFQPSLIFMSLTGKGVEDLPGVLSVGGLLTFLTNIRLG